MIKPILFCALCLSCLSCFARQEHPDSLLARRQFFKLRNEVAANGTALNEQTKLYYQSFLDNFFNRCYDSNKSIDLLLDQYPSQLNARQRIALLKLKIDNLSKTYQYRKAYAASTALLKEYGPQLKEEERKDISNTAIIWKSLQAAGPQQVYIEKDTRIPYKRDAAGLVNIPVHLQDTTWQFIFDTGANISVITESHAKRSRLTLMSDYFQVQAITGAYVNARCAIARTMKIGDIVVKDAVFMVFPDSSLSLAGGRYKIHGIIGFPVIEQLGEVRMNKQSYLEVPRQAVPADLSNFGLDELTPVVNVRVKNDSLPFTFDTGAQTTHLNIPFYRQFGEEVAAAKLVHMRMGGAGGVDSIPVYKLPELTLSLSGKTAKLQDIGVLTTALTEKAGYYYGNLGQDVLKQFEEVVISFKYMYVKLR